MDYASIIKSAKAALASAGAAISVTVTTDVYDFETGTPQNTKRTVYSGVGILKNYRDSLIAEGRINRGDKELLCIFDDAAFVPEASQKVLVNGLEWGVVDVKTVAPGGVDILYYLQVRR